MCTTGPLAGRATSLWVADTPTTPSTTPAMPSREASTSAPRCTAVVVELGTGGEGQPGAVRGCRRRGRGLEPCQAVLPESWHHQARAGALLPGGPGRRPTCARAATDDPEALRQRRRRGAVLSEARAGEPPAICRPRDVHVPIGTTRRRDRG